MVSGCEANPAWRIDSEVRRVANSISWSIISDSNSLTRLNSSSIAMELQHLCAVVPGEIAFISFRPTQRPKYLDNLLISAHYPPFLHLLPNLRRNLIALGTGSGRRAYHTRRECHPWR